MSDTWIKECCLDCETINWICLGNMQDIAGTDIEAIKCRSCGKIFMPEDINVEEYLLDFGYESIEDCYWEEGLEKPE